jgi:hypothetical protein
MRPISDAKKGFFTFVFLCGKHSCRSRFFCAHKLPRKSGCSRSQTDPTSTTPTGEKKRKFWHLKRATKIEKYKRNIQTTAEAI